MLAIKVEMAGRPMVKLPHEPRFKDDAVMTRALCTSMNLYASS